MNEELTKMGGIGRGRAEVIASKGCSRLFRDFSSSFRSLQSFSLEPTSPTSTATEVPEYPVKTMKSNSPFSGLVICVTGLSIGANPCGYYDYFEFRITWLLLFGSRSSYWELFGLIERIYYFIMKLKNYYCGCIFSGPTLHDS